MERKTGLEPATATLATWGSTTELLPPKVASRNLSALRVNPKCLNFFVSVPRWVGGSDPSQSGQGLAFDGTVLPCVTEDGDVASKIIDE